MRNLDQSEIEQITGGIMVDWGAIIKEVAKAALEVAKDALKKDPEV